MFLEKRRRRWYAAYDIPKDVRPFFRKKRLLQSLQTESKTEAERLVLNVVAGWKAEIEKIRKSDPQEQDINYWREVIKGASPFSEEGGEADRDVLLDQLREQAQKKDMKKKGSGVDFYQRVSGMKVGTKEYLDQWAASLNNAPKTNDMKVAAVRKLSTAFPTLQDINRRSVQLWAQKLITDGNLNPKTVKRDLSFCRQFWSFLQTLDVVDEEEEPFHKITITENMNANLRARRNVFLPADVVKLKDAAVEKDDQQLADLIEMAMWTGARLEELCSLKATDVELSMLGVPQSFKIVDAKTHSGWRSIPIHTKLAPTMERLLKTSEDGYVLSGLTKANKHGKRGNGLGKRFGRLKTSMGFSGGTEVFHSIRGTVMTLLKNAGVPEVTAADIAGHSKPTLTYGLYPGDPDFEVVREAIEKLSYPSSNSM